jgi:hypothetical protein
MYYTIDLNRRGKWEVVRRFEDSNSAQVIGQWSSISSAKEVRDALIQNLPNEVN